MRRALKKTCVVILIASLYSANLLQGATEAFNEYQIKAVFLFNFSQFVDWSQSAAPAPATRNAPFVIGVLGEDPFRAFLDATVRDETIRSRPFLVKRYRSVEEITACEILFVSHSERRQLRSILTALKDRATLTVSDVDDFAKSGGMIQFVTDNKRIKLLINLDAARAANLTLSSKLLRPATIVSGEKA